ncbi:MAG: peroxidase family protein [Polyangiaceae bacterium]
MRSARVSRWIELRGRLRVSTGVVVGSGLAFACQDYDPQEREARVEQPVAFDVDVPARELSARRPLACDVAAPRTLDGRCNNVFEPSLGAAETPFRYLVGQRYLRGPNEVLYFMSERPVPSDGTNHFPYVPTAAAPSGTCGPSGYEPACKFTIVPVEIHGFGPRAPYNARVLSNALHALDAPFAPPAPLPEPAGLTHLAAHFSAFLAHDVQKLAASVTPRRTRHGFANQSDPANATVLSGVPVVEPFDIFNVVPVYTPAGVPEPPSYRAIIISGPIPRRTFNVSGPALDFDNSATPYVDVDTLYGHSAAALSRLRSSGGRFLLTEMQSPAVGPIPPLKLSGLPPSFAETGLRDESALDGIEAYTPSVVDERNLSTIGTFAVQLLWIRFHNAMAERCHDRHPELNPATGDGDDALFECARKWTIAVYQHVVFDEFLPALIGRSLPPYRGYRPWVDPQIDLETILGPLSLHSTPAELSPIARRDGTWDERMHISLVGQPSPPPGAYPFIGSLFPIKAASAAFYFALAGIPTPLGDPTVPGTPWRLLEDPLSQITRGLAFFAHERNDLTVIDSQRNIPANYGLDLIAHSVSRNQQLGVAYYYEVREAMLPGQEGKI